MERINISSTLDLNYALKGLNDSGAYIYKLYLGEQCLYVGQSIALKERLMQHYGTGRKFDSFEFYETALDTLDYDEATEIVKCRPLMNITLPESVFYPTVLSLRNRIQSIVEDIDSKVNIAFSSHHKLKSRMYLERSEYDYFILLFKEFWDEFSIKIDEAKK